MSVGGMTGKRSRRGNWLKQQIVGIFHVETHSMRHDRIAMSFIPGEPLREMTLDEAVEWGHLFVVEALREQGQICTHEGVEGACCAGNLEMIRYLRAHDIHCTSQIGRAHV